MKIHCNYDKKVAIGNLIPHPKNPNTHSADQIVRLAKLMKYHGWRKPVTVSNQTGYIVRGHGRRLAAMEAGAMEVPVDYQDYESEDEELADLVADNKVSEFSHLDQGGLDEIVSILGESGYDIELTGFDIGEYEESRESGPDGASGDITADLVELPYIFKRSERDRIMKILNRDEDPVKTLLVICKEVEIS